MDSDQVAKYNDMINDARIKAILQAQTDIESSNGKNLLGQEITYGQNKGDKAIGKYQFVPKTIRDFASSPQFKNDKEVQELAAQPSSEDMLSYIKEHPGVDDRLALNYVEQANKSMGGDYDPEKITYAWQWGQNKTPADFEQAKADNPKVNERWAKVKQMFSDPYPPAGPPSSLANTEGSPTPIPNMSPPSMDVSDKLKTLSSMMGSSNPTPAANDSPSQQINDSPAPKASLLNLPTMAPVAQTDYYTGLRNASLPNIQQLLKQKGLR